MNLKMLLSFVRMSQCWSCLPTRCNPPGWVSTPDHPGGKSHWATSWQCHSWFCTDEQHRAMGNDGYWFCFTVKRSCGEPCCMCTNLPRFHPAVLRWFSSAQTQRRPGPWCRRSQCRLQLCSPLHKTSSPSPQTHWQHERRETIKQAFPTDTHSRTHTHTKWRSYPFMVISHLPISRVCM